MPIYLTYARLNGPITVTGNLAGKQVNCAISHVQGVHLEPGNYHISAPIKDPIYGTLAQVSGVQVRAYDPVKKKEIVGSASAKLNTTAADFAKFHMPATNFAKFHMPATLLNSDVVSEKVGPDHVSSGQVFVLCDKPVLGRSTLVVSMGFADLMDALQSSGGTTVTIS